MKKIFFSVLMSVALIASMALTSCDKKESKPEPPKKDDVLLGSIKGNVTLDAAITYIITGPVIVENGAVLNIPAGTMIKAKKGFENYILVLQGGKIFAKGTADKPTTMTADIANAQQGYWGGLIINGKAPLAGGTTGSTEINSTYSYGGSVANDNSGELTYLKLEYTGARSNADIEHNGLTLNGVGNGTKIENIYVLNGADDGVEFFGGTVNVKNLLVVNSDDDMFDVTQGWNGTLENCYGIWEAGYSSSESDPRGVEADGNLDGNNPTHTGQSDFIIKNMTIDLRLTPAGSTAADKPKRMQDAIKIRRGAKCNITNALIKGSGTVEDLVDFTDSKGEGNLTSVVNITNQLTNKVWREINPADPKLSGITLSSGNTGCPSNTFAWTGYKF